ncbi:MAG TPA: hypothetical protein DD657_00355 [Culturomica sp.]|jgi:hypothetical protein|nr:hypothetical protein [Culturomica sp.]
MTLIFYDIKVELIQKTIVIPKRRIVVNLKQPSIQGANYHSAVNQYNGNIVKFKGRRNYIKI